ncbi:hypothetical protein CBR_g19625 [Chara braunii]|uniref:Uncharacterized protein n=1 Tax=Chara braunii TaxID=69332 RepID=A0A388KYQ3_CHABU|nr:hypothetical protein CBR_g19625 [Chara braunii]|eukprot:GBG75112.1 hypothetical protein CBR_g19625 [Chara braunii]
MPESGSVLCRDAEKQFNLDFLHLFTNTSRFRALQEDTRQIRLELINREESYNKMFAANPVVQQGLADWLKPKNKENHTRGKSSSASQSSQKSAPAPGRRLGDLR